MPRPPEYDDTLMLRTVAEILVWELQPSSDLDPAYRKAVEREYGAADGSEWLRNYAIQRLRKSYPEQRMQLENAARQRKAAGMGPDIGTILGDAGQVGTSKIASDLYALQRRIGGLIASLTQGKYRATFEGKRSLMIYAVDEETATRRAEDIGVHAGFSLTKIKCLEPPGGITPTKLGQARKLLKAADKVFGKTPG